MTIVLYPLLCAALYYLLARATVTEFLWSRYPAWLDQLTACAACSGFWYGLGCAGLGWWRDWAFLGLDGRDPLTVALVGLCALTWTPIVAHLQIGALERLSPPAAEEGTAPPPVKRERLVTFECIEGSHRTCGRRACECECHGS